jgi:hypothetical protein
MIAVIASTRSSTMRVRPTPIVRSDAAGVCRSAQISVRASSKLFTAVFHEDSGAQMPLTVPALIFPEATGSLPFQRRRQFFLNKETPTSLSLQPDDNPSRAINARGFDSHQWRHYS